MSGLIFEGDTTKRFGEKFPKPFVQEIRVFDNAIEADVILYFKVSLEENVEENAKFFKDNLSDYELYSGFGSTASRNSMVEFDLVDGEIFNSDGERFIKLMLEKRIDFDLELSISSQDRDTPSPSATDAITSGTSLSERFGDDTFAAVQEAAQTLTLQKYFYCCTTLKEGESSNLNITQDLTIIDPTGGYNRIANSSSPLVYERVFKGDGTLNTDPVDAYQEANGNIYGQTPLMSLDRRYRKTDNITHKTVIDSVNAVIAPYIGTDITEADNIAVTLQTHKDDPQLLIKLSKQTKNFSNKSSVTPTGELYANMVDTITGLDNALLLEDVLEKRRFANAKIKDRRGDISLVKDNDFTEISRFGSSYIYEPLISRGVIKTIAGNIRQEDVLQSFILSNQSYYFFDYEKALNYETEISSFFNPYSLLQIFGNNCLNKYFKVQTAGVKKSKNKIFISSTSTTNIDLFYPVEEEGILVGSNIASSYTYQTTDSANNFHSHQVERKFAGPGLDQTIITNTIYSQIVERAFDTLDSIDGYRLKCYEIVDLENLETANQPTTYESKIIVKDTTMQFYEEHLRQPIMKMYEQLTRYLDFADDFCSFNNIDGRFNDFFVDAIQNEFKSPFPWHQGPLLYYSVLAALQASWEVISSKDLGFETRKRNGSSIDLDLVKQSAILKSRQISPSTGDLESLQAFVSDFRKFKDYFEVGEGLDKNNEIYQTLFDGTLSLKRKERLKTFERTTNLPEQINSNFDIEEMIIPRKNFSKLSPLDYANPTTLSTIENMIETIKDNFINDMEENHRDMFFYSDLTWEVMFEQSETFNLGLLSPWNEIYLQNLVPFLEFVNSNTTRETFSLADIFDVDQEIGTAPTPPTDPGVTTVPPRTDPPDGGPGGGRDFNEVSLVEEEERREREETSGTFTSDRESGNGGRFGRPLDDNPSGNPFGGPVMEPNDGEEPARESGP